MTLHFVSSADGNDGNSGLTLDLAWATIEFAEESGGLSAGDSYVVRRTHSEIPTSDVLPAYSGAAGNPIKRFGCPRSAHAISSSDWTNGSTSVVVDDADMSRSEHQTRHITGPDGVTYFITRVTNASNIVIDREYAGSTSLNDATASINADTVQQDWEDYDDSGDTIKKTDWEADADTVPLINFNGGAFNFFLNAIHYAQFYNLEFIGSTDQAGILRVSFSSDFYMEGILISSVNNVLIFGTNHSSIHFKRCTIEGNGVGVSQKGIGHPAFMGFFGLFDDVAIYNCGGVGMDLLQGYYQFRNVNMGVEIANGSDEFNIVSAIRIEGVDVKLGGTNGIIGFGALDGTDVKISFENYQKVLGDNRTYYIGGYFEKVAVSGETPNKKVSDYVMKVVPNVNTVPSFEFAPLLLTSKIYKVTTGSKTFEFWIYNDTGDTLNDVTALDNIFVRAESVDSFDDTTEYTMLDTFSTEIDIADAADADAWVKIGVTLDPATISKVRLKIFARYYNAATNFFIDQAVVIS